MRKYKDYKKTGFDSIVWTKYKIIVPTEDDRKELMEAFKHIHDSDVNSENIVINQLMHEYLSDEDLDPYFNNIIVNPEIYNKLTETK